MRRTARRLPTDRCMTSRMYRLLSSRPLAGLFVVLLALATAGCDDTVNPFIEDNRFFTLYGFLDPGAETQSLRVIHRVEQETKVDPGCLLVHVIFEGLSENREHGVGDRGGSPGGSGRLCRTYAAGLPESPVRARRQPLDRPKAADLTGPSGCLQSPHRPGYGRGDGEYRPGDGGGFAAFDA